MICRIASFISVNTCPLSSVCVADTSSLLPSPLPFSAGPFFLSRMLRYYRVLSLWFSSGFTVPCGSPAGFSPVKTTKRHSLKNFTPSQSLFLLLFLLRLLYSEQFQIHALSRAFLNRLFQKFRISDVLLKNIPQVFKGPVLTFIQGLKISS